MPVEGDGANFGEGGSATTGSGGEAGGEQIGDEDGDLFGAGVFRAGGRIQGNSFPGGEEAQLRATGEESLVAGGVHQCFPIRQMIPAGGVGGCGRGGRRRCGRGRGRGRGEVAAEGEDGRETGREAGGSIERNEMTVGENEGATGAVVTVEAKGQANIVAAGVDLAGAGGQDGAELVGNVSGGGGEAIEDPDMGATIDEEGKGGETGGGGGGEGGEAGDGPLAVVAVVVTTSGDGLTGGIAEDDGPGACAMRAGGAEMGAEVVEGEGIASGRVAIFAVAIGAIHEGTAGRSAGGDEGVEEGTKEPFVLGCRRMFRLERRMRAVGEPWCAIHGRLLRPSLGGYGVPGIAVQETRTHARRCCSSP